MKFLFLVASIVCILFPSDLDKNIQFIGFLGFVALYYLADISEKLDIWKYFIEYAEQYEVDEDNEKEEN